MGYESSPYSDFSTSDMVTFVPNDGALCPIAHIQEKLLQEWLESTVQEWGKFRAGDESCVESSI